MAVLKQLSTGQIFAGGITNHAHGLHIAKEAGVEADDFAVVFDAGEVTQLRRSDYSAQSDYLFFDYMAAVTEFGDSSNEANSAKQAWLDARLHIKNTYPKPE
ncbi:hypothetical protein [Pseudoalteromonas xiamenensis]|uniref:Uncharacterized protein n=1 Tax=Pseudoalteromonas xiamenensis TaxID=882626 RepID=A0A975HKE0_9GAMM|nr:hypothetical protein [Pseudoalteromonas xiamenensis]QTH70931.1 hypothetical protein J5O05_13760 [Pseudoalteromonas xiamenensis]